MTNNIASYPTTRKRIHAGGEIGDECARRTRSKHANSQEVQTPPKKAGAGQNGKVVGCQSRVATGETPPKHTRAAAKSQKSAPPGVPNSLPDAQGKIAPAKAKKAPPIPEIAATQGEKAAPPKGEIPAAKAAKAASIAEIAVA